MTVRNCGLDQEPCLHAGQRLRVLSGVQGSFYVISPPCAEACLWLGTVCPGVCKTSPLHRQRSAYDVPVQTQLERNSPAVTGLEEKDFGAGGRIGTLRLGATASF